MGSRFEPWREQDLAERERRLQGAGGFFRKHRRDAKGRADQPSGGGGRAPTANEVGGVVVRTWGLPVSVQTALMQHHAATADAFTHALSLADHLAHAVGDLSDDPEEELESPWLVGAEVHAVAVGIAPSKLPSLVMTTAEMASDVVASFSN